MAVDSNFEKSSSNNNDIVDDTARARVIEDDKPPL